MENKETEYKKLMDIIGSYMSSENIDLINNYYNYALKIYDGMTRMTGEEYICHSIRVAKILADLHMDTLTIGCALIHEAITLELATPEEIDNKFGVDALTILTSLSKLSHLKRTFTKNNNDADKYRRIVVGLSENPISLFIKLADRLDNLRTMYPHSTDHIKEVVMETEKVYIPIAHRLGIKSMKSELEDLCLQYSNTELYNEVLEKINASRSELETSLYKMRDEIISLLNEHEIKYEITYRVKSVRGIANKLLLGKKWEEIYDLLGLRILLDKTEDCYLVVGLIHSKFRPIPKRFKDFIANPKNNMYQSLHTTVFGVDNRIYEVQIRTYEMNEIAEHGVASHWSYKEKTDGSKTSELETKLAQFRTLIEVNDMENNSDFFKDLSNSITKEFIYIFTPKGDIIELPDESTPIDFAYRVHTDVGDKMVGAIVNNVIVPLDHELKDNDIIKINTNKNSFGPSREWINMAKTTGAKNKIKSFYRKIEKEEYLKKGEEALNKELRKRKIIFSDFLTNENMDKIIKELKYTNFDEVYINIGNNKLAIGAVINIVTGENNTKEDIILRKTQNKEVVLPSVKTDIIVEGIEDIKVNVASCCKPVPGDRIIGYITKGYGISVHRLACPNVKDLEERTISVRWNEVINKKYPTNLIIKTLKNDNLLLDIIAKTSNNNLTIQSIYNYNSKGDNTYDITVLVDNKENLKKFMAEVDSISSVTLCERHIK